MNSSNHNMSAVIIDDHPFARLALKTVLENQNIVVTGEAADDFHAIQLVDRLQPDIVIVDVMLIGSSGIDVVTKLRQNHYAGSIVMVSGKTKFSIVNAVSMRELMPLLAKKSQWITSLLLFRLCSVDIITSLSHHITPRLLKIRYFHCQNKKLK
ncbi:TPA: response regulator [Klebsiella pneumoniae]